MNKPRPQRLLLIVLSTGLVIALFSGTKWGSMIVAQSGETEGIRWQRNKEILDSMSPHELSELKKKKARFDGLEKSQQQKMRTLHNELMSHQNRDELVAIMNRYCDWCKSLNKTQEEELATAGDQRIAKIKEIRDSQATENFGSLFPDLDQEDVPKVFKWVGKLLEDRHEQIDAELANNMRQRGGRRWRRTRANTPASQRFYWLLLTSQDDPGYSPLWLISDQDIADLRSAMSDKTRNMLDGKSDPQELRQLVFTWVKAAVTLMHNPRMAAILHSGSSTRSIPVEDHVLIEFYEQMTPDERSRLEHLPGDRWFQELVRQYFLSLLNPPTTDEPDPASGPD